MQVLAILNEFYVNITKHLTSETRNSIDLNAEALNLDNEQILKKINDKYENHPSVKDIKDRISESISFSFAKTSVCDIIKITTAWILSRRLALIQSPLNWLYCHLMLQPNL